MNRLSVKELRKAAGLTLEALAEKVGVRRQTISSWERGTLPSGEMLDKLCAALGVTKDRLQLEEDWERKYYRLLEEYNQCLKRLAAYGDAPKKNKPVAPTTP